MARRSFLKPVDIGMYNINLLYYVQFDGHQTNLYPLIYGQIQLYISLYRWISHLFHDFPPVDQVWVDCTGGQTNPVVSRRFVLRPKVMYKLGIN